MLQVCLFWVSYQRRKMLQNNLFWFLINAEIFFFDFFQLPQSASEKLVFGFLSAPENASEFFLLVFYQRCLVLPKYFFRIAFSAAELLFLVSYQRRKKVQNYFFWFIINASKCFRIVFFLVSYQPRKVLQKYLFFGFLSAPENALELLSFSFSSTLLSSAELLFLVFINAMKCCRITSYWFITNAAK